MDKNAIKKYAVWAREQLIEKVTARAIRYEIVDGQGLDDSLETINGEVLTETEKKQRKALIQKIKSDGYGQVMEEVAYTWFNRFVAIRFMEVNGYLPSHVRVFSDENGAFKPQILEEAIHLDLPGLDMDKVMQYKEEANEEELFKYLLKVQCNALNEILPQMFQKIEDYTELLLPDYLLRDGSVIEKLVNEIPEDNFDVNTENGQIEVIGWMYQYYISAKHEEVIDPIHGKVIKKEEVPAATQLFTTDWVVRFLIDNSVGRYWVERNGESRISEELRYFVKSQEVEVRIIDETIMPQDVTIFDPCVGSGHFLVYAFDVLMKIYVEYGYSERDAASEIVKNNLYGLDIDGRATQLAYFAIMMKARQYDRRFFTKKIQPHGLNDELSPEVAEKDVTVRKADLKRDIRSFLSFAVGCMFGRYSLDEKGLAYAGGEWKESNYRAIIPICDDEYFSDDIVGRLIDFVKAVYGAVTLEDNLQFIANALGGNGSSREVIRNYFINDFYSDHLKIYQKCPIYWMFDSGKNNGFKCLVYMHRYKTDTIARIRTDYVHEQQARYRTAIEEIEKRIDTVSASEKVKLTKKLNTLKEQDEEIHTYEEKIHHLADQMISINLDDGVKHNYALFQDVLAKIK